MSCSLQPPLCWPVWVGGLRSAREASSFLEGMIRAPRVQCMWDGKSSRPFGSGFLNPTGRSALPAASGCGKVTIRADPTLARGLDLGPPPPEARFRFQGHAVALQESNSRYMRRAAAASGGSCWFFNAGLKLSVAHDRMKCSCGAAAPSRPHVTWSCPTNEDLRRGHQMPLDRAAERLFARPTPQMPAAPEPSDTEDFARSLDSVISRALQPGEPSEHDRVYVATDGSSERSVGAFAVVVGEPSQAFAAGSGSEDQEAYRQEALALHATLASLHRVWQPGMKHCVFIVTDCMSAMQAVTGGGGALGSMPLLMQSARSLLSGLGARGCRVSFVWGPLP